MEMGIVCGLVCSLCSVFSITAGADGRPDSLEVLAEPAAWTVETQPGGGEHHGFDLSIGEQGHHWSCYDVLKLRIWVDGEKGGWNGRLRCYYQGPNFRDIVVNVDPKSFGSWQDISVDLNALFEGVSRDHIHKLWFYTFDKWYSHPSAFEVKVADMVLSQVNDNADWQWTGTGFDYVGPPDPSYSLPPNRTVWIEGEGCTDHNFPLGPTYNCWAFEYGDIHGGVLDLAAWRLPECGEFYARYSFELPDSAAYIVYYLGRDPAYQSSPITWQIDDGPEQSGGVRMDTRMSIKYALTRLGTFAGTAGNHTITIRVKEAYTSFLPFYSQQIDAILISREDERVIGVSAPAPLRQHGAPSAEIGGWASAVAAKGFEIFSENLAVLPHDKEDYQEVRAGKLSVKFSSANGGIYAVTYEGKTMLETQEPYPLLQVSFLGGAEAVNARPIRWRQEGDAIRADYVNEAFDAQLTIRPDKDNDELRLSASVTNTSDEPIWRVSLAPLLGVALNGESKDDYCYLGQDRFGSGTHRRISPQLKFDWACVTDQDLTLHVRYEDKGVLDTEAFWGRGDSTPGFVLMRKFPRILPGETWDVPEMVIGADASGGWHEAADRYSQWWHRWALRPHIPDWIKSVGGITLAYAVKTDDAIAQNTASVQRLNETLGIYWGHTSNWLRFVTECWYPLNYRIDFEQLKQFRNVTDALRAAGGRMSIYSNPLMFSRVTPDFELYGKDLAAVARDGSIWLSEHHTRHHPMALPYPNAQWANHYLNALEAPVLLGRPDLLYLDQLGAVPSHLDFDPDKHHHTHYGQWVAGTVEFVREVHERLCPRYPELATMIECPCPAAQQYITLGFLGGNEVLRYTFPYYPNVIGAYGALPASESLDVAREAFLLGQPMLMISPPEEVQSDIRNIVCLKQYVDPWLYEAHYRDTLGLSCEGELDARVFVRDDGGLYFTLCNPLQEPVEFSFDTKRYPVKATTRFELITSEDAVPGVSLPYEVEGGRCYVTVPGDTFGLIRSH